MKRTFVLIQLCLIAQHQGHPPSTVTSRSDEGGNAFQAKTSCKCEKDEGGSASCYKPTESWTEMYSLNPVKALMDYDEGCVNDDSEKLMKTYRYRTVRLGEDCYMRCPCRCSSFCENSNYFSKSTICPFTTSEGLYCITSDEGNVETAKTRLISTETPTVQHSEGSIQSNWYASTRNDEETDRSSVASSSFSSSLTNPSQSSSFQAFSSALTSPALPSTPRTSTLTSTVLPSTLRAEPVHSSKILSTSTSLVPATSYANSMERLESTASRQSLTTAGSVEGDAATTHIDRTPSTTGTSSLTSYFGHTDTFASEEIQSSAFSPSKSQERIRTTYVAHDESDSAISDAYSSVGSLTSKDVVKTASSHAFETTSTPLKGSQTVQMTSPYTKTDEDVESSTFDGEMERVSSSTFGEEHLRTATSSDEMSSTNVQAMEQAARTTITAVSKVEVSSHDPTTRASFMSSAPSTIASSQGYSTDVDLEHRTQTTSRYSPAKKATTEKLFSRLFYTSKVETSTTPKSSSLTGVNEMQQTSETTTPSTAARLSDSSRRLSTVPFPFTTHGHYHHSSTISWSSSKATESGSTDTSTSDASSASTTRLPVTDASLEQQEKSSTAQTLSTAGTTVDTQQMQTTADTSINHTDSVTDSSPNCSLPCPPEYVEGASYCYRFAHKSVHTYRAAVRYCSLEKNSYLASLVDLRKDEIIPILRNASDENSTLAELLFINEQKSKFFTVTKTARIVSLTRSSGTLLRIVRTVAVDEYLANATGICKIPNSIGSNTMTFSTSSRGNVPSSMDTVDDTEEQMVVEQNLPTATEPENQVDTLATRMANNVGPIGSDQQCVNPAATPRGASTRVPMAERWETSAPEVNLKRTIESIIAVVFPRVDEKASLSSTTNVDHVDWHCPRKLMYQGVEVECPTAVILQDVIPNAPFGALKFSSPYDLSRLLTILSQSHIPESWRTARLLDRTYDITSPTGLGLAWSFYRQNCIHLTLASVSEAGYVIPDHPSRGDCDPYNLASIADIARRYAETHPWTKSSWTELKPRKNLIILPVGFERVVDCLKTESQKAVVLKKPEEMLPEWFVEDYSSIVLFSLAEFAGTTRWRGAWTLLMQQVARGAELMILAGPENDREWKRSLDMLRDLCEETVAQRPSLRTHIRCLLPYRSQYEMIGAGFRAATYEQGKLFTESAAKRFWASTMAQHSAFISLAPFRRKSHQNAVKRGAGHTPYHQRNTPNYQAQSSAQRGQSQHRGGSRYRGHHNRGGYTARKPLTEMPIHKIGNQMYKLVPIKDSKRNPFPLRGLSSRGGRRF